MMLNNYDTAKGVPRVPHLQASCGPLGAFVDVVKSEMADGR